MWTMRFEKVSTGSAKEAETRAGFDGPLAGYGEGAREKSG